MFVIFTYKTILFRKILPLILTRETRENSSTYFSSSTYFFPHNSFCCPNLFSSPFQLLLSSSSFFLVPFKSFHPPPSFFFFSFLPPPLNPFPYTFSLSYHHFLFLLLSTVQFLIYRITCFIWSE